MEGWKTCAILPCWGLEATNLVGAMVVVSGEAKGLRECPVRVRAPLEEATGWRLGVSAPELARNGPKLLDEQSEADGQAGEVQGYPGYSWRETLCRFPALLQLYPLAAASEDPGSEAGGAIDGLEGNEELFSREYLNGHPGSSQGLQPAANSQVSPERSANSGAQTPRSNAEMAAKDMRQVNASTQPTISGSVDTQFTGREARGTQILAMNSAEDVASFTGTVSACAMPLLSFLGLMDVEFSASLIH
eukprot:symbB.v1.2.033868.t1/scaffold4271.1/size42099/1